MPLLRSLPASYRSFDKCNNQGWPGYIPGYIPNLPTGLGFLCQKTRVFLIESGFFITLT